eukprot:PhF_6_TR18636/c1_g1_i1/m.27242
MLQYVLPPLEDEVTIMESLQSPTTREYVKFRAMMTERINTQTMSNEFEQHTEILEGLVLVGEDELRSNVLQKFTETVKENTCSTTMTNWVQRKSSDGEQQQQQDSLERYYVGKSLKEMLLEQRAELNAAGFVLNIK